MPSRPFTIQNGPRYALGYAGMHGLEGLGKPDVMAILREAKVFAETTRSEFRANEKDALEILFNPDGLPLIYDRGFLGGDPLPCRQCSGFRPPDYDAPLFKAWDALNNDLAAEMSAVAGYSDTFTRWGLYEARAKNYRMLFERMLSQFRLAQQQGNPTPSIPDSQNPQLPPEQGGPPGGGQGNAQIPAGGGQSIDPVQVEIGRLERELLAIRQRKTAALERAAVKRAAGDVAGAAAAEAEANLAAQEEAAILVLLRRARGEADPDEGMGVGMAALAVVAGAALIILWKRSKEEKPAIVPMPMDMTTARTQVFPRRFSRR